VRFEWQEGETPWLRVLTNYGGEGYGIYFVPEVGDEVFIDFEQGNPDRPYVAGAKYHKKNPPEWAKKHSDKNSMKAIKTRGGHKVEFDDSDGSESILITDKKGNKMHIDTSGESIAISSNSSVSISSTDITITAKNDITLSADNDITLVAKNNVAISANKDVLVSGQKKANVSGKTEAAIVSGSSGATFKPTEGKISSTAKLELTSTTVKVGGNAAVEVTGGTIKLN